jgi:hypothetical protein
MGGDDGLLYELHYEEEDSRNMLGSGRVGYTPSRVITRVSPTLALSTHQHNNPSPITNHKSQITNHKSLFVNKHQQLLTTVNNHQQSPTTNVTDH